MIRYPKFFPFLFVMLLPVSGGISAQTSLNISLFGTLNPVPGEPHNSGSWGWTSPSGAEYALLGGFLGTHIISIDDSMNIHQVDFVDGQNNNWREITVIGNHAYVVTEGGGDLQGMQVIDLSPLPDSVHLVGTYTTTFSRAHIIMKDISSDSAIVYVSGTSTTGGVHMIDVSDPSSPTEVGLYDPPYYIHDAHVRGNLLFASALSTGLDIVDITDKENPTLLSHIDHQSQFTHSAWTTDDLSHVVVTDEVDGLPARIWNIEDLDNPFEVSQYSGNLQSLVHNPYVLGDLVFLSHNTEGLTVLDIDDPALPVEVGFYDTYDGPSGGYHGLWSAYPYFPSGKIIGGNREDGLYVWKFNGTRAVRVYGAVLDSLSGEPIGGGEITIVQTGSSTTSGLDGVFRIGELPPDASGYTLTASANGYAPASVDSLFASGGDDSLWVEFKLRSLVSSVDGDRVPHETMLFQNYPNPFNGASAFGFRLSDISSVTLAIYDLLGREVARLADEDLAPGIYTRVWDGTDHSGIPVSSGVYLYRLSAGRVVQTRSLLLLK